MVRPVNLFLIMIETINAEKTSKPTTYILLQVANVCIVSTWTVNRTELTLHY